MGVPPLPSRGGPCGVASPARRNHGVGPYHMLSFTDGFAQPPRWQDSWRQERGLAVGLPSDELSANYARAAKS